MRSTLNELKGEAEAELRVSSMTVYRRLDGMGKVEKLEK